MTKSETNEEYLFSFKNKRNLWQTYVIFSQKHFAEGDSKIIFPSASKDKLKVLFLLVTYQIIQLKCSTSCWALLPFLWQKMAQSILDETSKIRFPQICYSGSKMASAMKQASDGKCSHSPGSLWLLALLTCGYGASFSSCPLFVGCKTAVGIKSHTHLCCLLQSVKIDRL